MARSISDEEIQLKRRARRRLIGAIVLVTAIVVALPMVLDTEPKPISSDVSIRIPAPDSGGFTSRVVPVVPSGEPEQPSRHSAETKAPPKGGVDKPAPPAPSPPSKVPKAAEPPAVARSESTPAKDAPAKADKSAAKEPPAAKADKSAAKEPPAAQADKPAAKDAPAAGDPFVVQVIALADAEKAKEVQAQIAAAGLKSYTEVVKTVKGEVTRVRAGPFPSRAAAEKAQEQLKAVGLAGNVIPK